MLAGLEDVSTGSIYIGDAKVNDLPPGARGLGMMFQSYALYPRGYCRIYPLVCAW